MPEDLQMMGQMFHQRLLGMPPFQAQAVLGGWLASVLGQLPDPFWKEMFQEAIAPCGQPDCGCETVKIPVMKGLDLLREDFKQQTLSCGHSE